MSDRSTETRRISVDARAYDGVLDRYANRDGTVRSLRDGTASQPELSWSLTELSVVICEIHSLCARHEEDHQLRVELSAVATHIEDIVHDLLLPPHHAHAMPRRGNPRASHPSAVVLRQRRHEDALIAWLNSVTKPDAVSLDGPGSDPTPLTYALGQLTVSQRELPSNQASMLQLDAPATIGAVASELLRAVNDPAGPNCRSYRAAYHYLVTRS